MEGPPKVLYVMGHGWSGSTILGNLLGELEGFFHAGELRRLWGEAIPANERCGCRQPLRDCPVWSRVLAHPLLAGLDPAEVDRWHRAARVRRTPHLLRLDRAGATREPDLDRYLDVSARLYRAIADTTRSSVVVDTSKRSGDAAALLLTGGVDAYFAHLVRDPRAVAHSWARRPGGGQGPVATARAWTAFNVLDEAIRRRAGSVRSVRLRYEDLVAEPAGRLRAIAEMMGERPERLPVREGRVASLGVNHGVMGNPSRFVTGDVELREDDEWKRAQSRARRLLITSLTVPLLLRYRYPVVPAGRRLP